ncbi:PREDICTED: ribosomal L1 domain-containing protein 1-like [Ipomoea nil]|uniref:ribosomal L1 domain-containing protein 1-like n=1 Tax=Ipomoea nil TaxID=35883 RepID=UPI000900D5AD|nr:PREDICTED: ribosomal L1 domain-containing protein 1-like [Ipomoea nil]
MADSSSTTAGKLGNNNVSEGTVRKAVNALLKWKKLQWKSPTTPRQSAEGDEEDNDDLIYLVLTLKKIPPKDLSPVSNPIKIPLPHPLQSFSDICLIVGDKPTQVLCNPIKTTLASEAVQKKIKSLGIPITRVLKLSKLKSDFKSFEAKRKLNESHDLFLADKRVVHLLPGVLGKQFYKNKKRVPVPVELKGNGNWKEEMNAAAACKSTLLCFGSGTCTAVKVGNGNGVMDSQEIMENVVAAIDAIASLVPKKWAGIRALHLKLLDSVALPIYDSNEGNA